MKNNQSLISKKLNNSWSNSAGKDFKRIVFFYGILFLIISLSILFLIASYKMNNEKKSEFLGVGYKIDNEKKTKNNKNLKSSVISDLGLKITYPEEWGEVRYDKKNSFPNIINFSNFGDSVNDEFDLRIITMDDLIKSNDHFSGESWVYNLDYLDYLKDINESAFEYNCDKQLYNNPYYKCFKPEKKLINSQNYLTNIGFSVAEWSGWEVDKKWILFLGDKIIIARNNLADVVSKDFNQDIYNNKNLNFPKIKSLIYADLKIDEVVLLKKSNGNEELLGQISFENLDSTEEIANKFERKNRFKAELMESKDSASKERLDELSRSDFFMVRFNVASNKNTPSEVLVKLSESENDYIKTAVKRNNNTPKEIADSMPDGLL